MKKVFIDANILIDYLSSRSNEKNRKLAIAVIHYCYTRLEKAFISTHSFMVLFHVLDQQFSDKSVLKQKLERAYNLFNVVSITDLSIKAAFKNSVTDFEDAVQIQCAMTLGADLIVTNNLEDFYSIDITVVPPSQFFDFI